MKPFAGVFIDNQNSGDFPQNIYGYGIDGGLRTYINAATALDVSLRLKRYTDITLQELGTYRQKNEFTLRAGFVTQLRPWMYHQH